MSSNSSSINSFNPSNQRYLLSQLSSLVNDANSQFNDVRIIKRNHLGEQETYYSNSLMLSCASPVFHSMLTTPHFEEYQTKTIHIPPQLTAGEQDYSQELAQSSSSSSSSSSSPLPDECYVPSDTFLEFVRFCSSGQCELTLDNVVSLMNLAQKYSVFDLLDSSVAFVARHLLHMKDVSPTDADVITMDTKSTDWSVVLDVMAVAKSCQVQSLIDTCAKMASYHCRELLFDTSAVESLDETALLVGGVWDKKLKVRSDVNYNHWDALLQYNKFSIGENALFRCLEQWITEHRDELSIEQIRSLLYGMRLPTLRVHVLRNSVIPFIEKLQDEQLSEYGREALQYAESCEKLTPQEIRDKQQNLPLHYQQRLMRLVFAFGNSDKNYPGYRLITWTEFSDTLYHELKLYYDHYKGLLNLEYGSQPPFQSANCCFRVADAGYVAIQKEPIYPFDTGQNCNGQYKAKRFKFVWRGKELCDLPEASSFELYYGCSHNTNPGIFVSVL